MRHSSRSPIKLPLNATAMGVLVERQKTFPGPNDYVFPDTLNQQKGKRLLLRAFYIAMARAGIENFRFHDLRHTFATRMVQNGVSIFDLQKLGRWKTVSMVMRYAHHNPESLRSAIEVMDGSDKPFITNLSHLPKRKSERPYLRLVTN
ncbi:MAG TPA: site-specific integrase [Deltaproteobacteria bacterium]|nr:site-specific integrase [Deltaproteobacteria bacterium]